jgi:hypothetical protein
MLQERPDCSASGLSPAAHDHPTPWEHTTAESSPQPEGGGGAELEEVTVQPPRMPRDPAKKRVRSCENMPGTTAAMMPDPMATGVDVTHSLRRSIRVDVDRRG